MFDLSIVLTLALGCLQVSGTPIAVYNQLGQCFINSHKGFFLDFFPYKIESFPISGDNFSGTYTHVELSGLEHVIIHAEQKSKDSDSAAVIEFNNTFSQIVVSGHLTGTVHSVKCEGQVSGSAKNVHLNGKVWYIHPKVTKLELDVTVGKVSIKFEKGKTPFTDVQTTGYFQKYFADNKDAIAEKSIQLINARINTPEKIAEVKKECRISV